MTSKLEEFAKGFRNGAGLVLIELAVFAVLLASEAIASTSVKTLLAILIPVVLFIQNVIEGSCESREFLVGFFSVIFWHY